MTSSSNRRPEVLLIAGFFTIAAYTSFGCGIPSNPWPKPDPNAVRVNGIGGSAYCFEGFAEGPVKIEVTAKGYEPQRVSSALLAGYNKERVVLRRRSR